MSTHKDMELNSDHPRFFTLPKVKLQEIIELAKASEGKDALQTLYNLSEVLDDYFGCSYEDNDD